MHSRPAARRPRLAIAALAAAVISLPALAFGQAPEDSTATFRKQLESLLDRWNDAAPADRIGKAIELCESFLKKSKGEDKEGEVDARLELVRLKLAKGDNEGAALAAEKIALDAKSERKGEVEVLYLMAYERSTQEKAAHLEGADQKKLVDEYRKKDHDLVQKLIETAGSMDDAKKLFFAESQKISTAQSLSEVGKPPRAIDKPDLDGKPIKLSDYAGKVVMIDFWATWCGPCMAEMPNVLKVRDEFKGRGFEIIGVSLDQDRARLDATLKDKGMTWRQYFDGKGWENALAVAWGVHSIPHTYLIDHTGKVRYVDARGEGLAAAVKDLVERAEKAKGSSAEPPKKGD